jgi:hypothetical protein
LPPAPASAPVQGAPVWEPLRIDVPVAARVEFGGTESVVAAAPQEVDLSRPKLIEEKRQTLQNERWETGNRQ